MTKKKEYFLVDVVPLTRIPLTRNQSFWYLHETELSLGTLVSVPLFRRKVEGIVLSSKSDFQRFGKIKLRPIEKIIENDFLDENQIKLAGFISDYYVSPLGIVLKNFVPRQTRRKKKEERRKTNFGEKITLTKDQQKAVDKIISCFLLPASRFLLFGPSGSGKTEIYIETISKLKAQNSKLQFLILLPEQTLTPQALERYGAHFKPEEIVILSSNISKGQYYSNWQRIKSGEAKIIIGTRMAVFAPFKNLGLIVIDEEQDMSFKQWDMNPRYDARTVAGKLAEIHKCPVVSGSATPRIETYYKAVVIRKDMTILKLPELRLEERRKRREELVDMKKERWQSKNYGCISKKLKSEIEYALKNKLQTVLFINRQGMSSFSVCESCKEVLRCPKCDRALIYTNQGNYKCLHCSHKSSIVPQCSKCKGINFKNIGLGTQKVEKEIEKLFPGAKIARIDSESTRKRRAREEIYGKFSRGEIDILIGTQMVSKNWDFPNLTLVAAIDADSLLSVPDFFNEEKTFQNLVQISGRVGRAGARFPGTVVTQTFNPENKFWKLVQEKDFQSFFEKETRERKALHIPPFGKIIKLIFQDYNERKVEKETGRVYNLLRRIKNVKVTQPQAAFIPKIRGRSRVQMIVKYEEEIPRELKRSLQMLSGGWIVDVDPVSIT